MDDFFNYEYANEVADYFSNLDPDTARMLGLMVTHDVLHQHIDDNRATISKRVNEILTDIAEQVSKASDDPAVRELVSKALNVDTETWDNPYGGGTVQRRVTRDSGGRFASGNYSIKTNPKTGKIKVKYKGPKDGWDPRLNDFDLVSALGAAGKQGNSFEERWNAGVNPRNTNQRTYNRVAVGSQTVRDIGIATNNTPMAVGGAVGTFAGSFGPSAEKVVGTSIRRAAYRYRGTEKAVDPELKTAIRSEIALRMRDQGPMRAPLTSGQKAQITRAANEAYKNRSDKSQTLSQIRNEMYAAAQRNSRAIRTPLSPDQRRDVAEQAAVQHLSTLLPDATLANLQAQSGKIPPSQGVLIDSDGNVVAQAVGYQEDHFLPFNLKNMSKLNGGSYVRTRSSGGLTTEDIYTGLMTGARSVTVVSRSGTFTIDFEDDFRGVRRYGDVARQMVGRYGAILDAVQSKQIERMPLTQMERAQIRADVESEYSSMKSSQEGREMIEREIKLAMDTAKRSTEPSLREMEVIEAEVERQMQMRDSVGQTPDGGRHAPLPRDPDTRAAVIRNELVEDLRAQKEARMLQLDGQGYETALQALKEQYPYFIKSVERTNPYKDPERKRPKSRETDSGYVRPNYLRPKEVQAGYFDPEIEGFKGKVLNPGTSAEIQTGKYSAASTNYQNRANRMKAEDEKEPTPTVTAGGEGKAGAAPDKPKGSPSMSFDIEGVKARHQGLLDMATYIAENQTKTPDAKLKGFFGDNRPGSEEGQRAARRALTDPKNVEHLNKLGEAVLVKLKNDNADGDRDDVIQKLETWLDSARAPVEDKELDADYSRSPEKPAKFEKEVPGGRSIDFYSNLMATLGKKYRIAGDDDNMLRDASDASLDLAKIYERISAGDSISDADKTSGVLAIQSDPMLQDADEETAFAAMLKSPNQAKVRAKYHRTRSRDLELFRRALLEHDRAVKEFGGK